MNKLDSINTLLEEKDTPQGTLPSSFYEIGEKYLFRTVTMIYTGKIKDIKGDTILIENAAWIPETERWNECVKHAKFKEVEPYAKEVIVHLGGMLDATKLDSLPTEPK